MKVNPLGIQAYQQPIRQERPAAGAGDMAAAQADKKILIEPQSPQTKSVLAVKAAGGSYAQSLSSEERQALDLLFARFSNSSRFGHSYQAENSAASGDRLGRLVDVKV